VYAWEPGHGPDDLPLAPAPVWLVQRLRQEPRQDPHQQETDTHTAPARVRVASALAAIPNNDADYDEWLMLGMALHSTGGDWARELWDIWSRQSSKFDEGKQAKSWASFGPMGKQRLVHIGSLFHRAKACGWRPPETVEPPEEPPVSGTHPRIVHHAVPPHIL